MDNPVLKAIRERRSVHAFLPSKLEVEALGEILSAGRWAPSWVNSQPWSFIVVTSKALKKRIGEIGGRKTHFSKPRWMDDAAAIICVAVDPEKDPKHYVEDGAIAAQNIALAAHSLGYESYYLGIYGNGEGTTAEEEIKELLQVPEKMRIIAVLPIGVPERLPESSRKELNTLVHYNKYSETAK